MDSEKQTRARNCILGALVADAASMGFHWLYSQRRISELAPDQPEFREPSEEDYLAAYCERTGRPAGISNRDFYSAYNFFRIAAILQGIAGRVRDGTAASTHAERATKAVAPLAEMGWQYAVRAS